jgi:predicted AAA+ superfamily ATPase
MMALYYRPQLAERMARQLLNPGVLDEGLCPGLLISGLRRTGKTTFLIADLVPAQEAGGAIVIYVDLSSDTLTSPSNLLPQAIEEKLKELETPSSVILDRLKKINGLDLGGFGFKFGFSLRDLGKQVG